MRKPKLPKADQIGKSKNNGGVPPVEYRFKPGVSGNPKGRPPNPIPKVLKELTIDSYRKVIEAVCTGNVDEIKKMIDDPNVSALQVGVATAVLRAIAEGNYEVIERIAERIVGKIPEELKVSATTVNANMNATVDKEKLKSIIDVLQKEV